MFGGMFKLIRFARKVDRAISRFDHKPSYSDSIPQPRFEGAYTKPAQSEAIVKSVITQLPEVRVLSVIDGDTAIVSKGWSEITLRLDSIDCPEDGQEWGDIAGYGLIKLIGGKRVRIEEHGIDIHRRTLATIYIWDHKKNDWMNVNERMVTLGHAWVMRSFYGHLPKDRQDKLNRLEKWAKSKSIGLWKSPNPMPPWQWRKNK